MCASRSWPQGQGSDCGGGIPLRDRQRNLDTWTLPDLDKGHLQVWYHFSLGGEPGTRPETAPVGNKFDRFFLRIVQAPTKRVVQVCDDSRDPTETEVRQGPSEDGGYEVRVFVASRTPCLFLYAP
jgi:hypothetical protein